MAGSSSELNQQYPTELKLQGPTPTGGNNLYLKLLKLEQIQKQSDRDTDQVINILQEIKNEYIALNLQSQIILNEFRVPFNSLSDTSRKTIKTVAEQVESCIDCKASVHIHAGSEPLTSQNSTIKWNIELVKRKKAECNQEMNDLLRCQQLPLPSSTTFHEEKISWGHHSHHKHPESMLIKMEDHRLTDDEMCIYCNATFPLRGDLATHISNTHSDFVFHCDVCDKICYGNKHQFIEHFSNHLHIEVNAKDKTVNNYFSSNSSSSNPIESRSDFLDNTSRIGKRKPNVKPGTDNKNNSFVCSICKKTLTRSYDLKRHMKIHFYPKPVAKYPDVQETSIVDGDKKKFPCNVCGRILTRKFDLQRHINTHISKSKDLETVFGINTSNSSDDSNSTAHDDSKHNSNSVIANESENIEQSKKVFRGNFPCNICHKTFTRRFDLKRHGKQHTPGEMTENAPIRSSVDYEAITRAKVVVNDRTLYRCEQCSKHLYTRASYVKHLRIHSGEKPFTCHVCGRQFRTSALLNRHVRDVHEGIKKYPCDICGRKFAHKRAKNEHRRVHTGERPCVCHLCGKAFKTKASLYVHSKFHLDIFPHSCPHCQKQFRRRHHLNVHLLLHTGEKPHACHICGKSFRLSKTLKDHVVIHTNKETFECSICGKHFAQERYLKNHARSHRPQILNRKDIAGS